MTEKRTFGEEVKDRIFKKPETIPITISFPKDVLTEFQEYSKIYANDCYWLGILRLLRDAREESQIEALNEKVDSLFMLHGQLRQQFNEIIKKPAEEAEKEKKKEKRFGKNE